MIGSSRPLFAQHNNYPLFCTAFICDNSGIFLPLFFQFCTSTFCFRTICSDSVFSILFLAIFGLYLNVYLISWNGQYPWFRLFTLFFLSFFPFSSVTHPRVGNVLLVFPISFVRATFTSKAGLKTSLFTDIVHSLVRVRPLSPLMCPAAGLLDTQLIL